MNLPSDGLAWAVFGEVRQVLVLEYSFHARVVVVVSAVSSWGPYVLFVLTSKQFWEPYGVVWGVVVGPL